MKQPTEGVILLKEIQEILKIKFEWILDLDGFLLEPVLHW